jgi:ABC-2 type transport system permease protein
MGINKYVKIYIKMLKYSFIQASTYRFNFILGLIVEIGYQMTIILFINVIYGNIYEIAGWNYNQMLLLIGIHLIVTELFMGTVYISNLSLLPERIKDGEIDFSLLKPFSSLFMLTASTPILISFVSLLPGIYLVVTSLMKLSVTLTGVNILVFLIMFICGFIIEYAIATILTSFAFLFINAQKLPEISNNVVFSFAKNPHQSYQGFLRLFFTFICPVIFVSSIPASTLIRNIEWNYIALGIAIAGVFLILTIKIWNIMIRNYTSASS